MMMMMALQLLLILLRIPPLRGADPSSLPAEACLDSDSGSPMYAIVSM